MVQPALQNADYVFTTSGTAPSGPAPLGLGAVAGTLSQRRKSVSGVTVSVGRCMVPNGRCSVSRFRRVSYLSLFFCGGSMNGVTWSRRLDSHELARLQTGHHLALPHLHIAPPLSESIVTV